MLSILRNGVLVSLLVSLIQQMRITSDDTCTLEEAGIFSGKVHV